MNDRFLFRAWDKNGKGFINGFNMYGFSTGQGAPIKKLQRFSSEWDMNDVVLMQCTGLKDKNDKLIFEGDVLQNEPGYSFSGVYAGVINVHQDETGYYWDTSISSCLLNKEFCEHVEIIGNIHNNPVLLNK